jgi:hypothetical protein
MDHRKTNLEMLADGLREFGLLMAVFVPLDGMFQTPPWPLLESAKLALMAGGIPFVAGMALERYRKHEGE